jgi:hypothetical protein
MGPLIFVCQWPALRIEESRVEFDAGQILDAAARSRQLWPDQVTAEDTTSAT